MGKRGVTGEARRRVSLLWLAALLILQGCQMTGPGPSPAPAAGTPTASAHAPTTRASPSGAAGSTATPAARPLAASTPSPGPSGPAQPLASPAETTVVASGLQEPDDLAVDAGGNAYVSDVGDGTVRRIDATGRTTLMLSGLREPEGMAFLPGGNLIIAEQVPNRIDLYNATTHRLVTLLSLSDRTGQAGVDGIALDSHATGQLSLIIPDSANGVVLRASLDGKQVRTIGRGFVRPVAAWVERDGNILVTDEFGNRLQRLYPDGRQVTVASLPQPDDVVEDGSGRIYVNTLVDGAIHEIDSAAGTDRVIVRGLGLPQGLALDAHGALLVTDPGHHRVLRVAAS